MRQSCVRTRANGSIYIAVGSDTVMGNGTPLLPAPLDNVRSAIADADTEEEILLLTGPETDTKQTTSSRATVKEPSETVPATETPVPPICVSPKVTSNKRESIMKPEYAEASVQSPAAIENLPFTPPAAEISQGSSPATTKTTTNLHKREMKSQGAKPSVRRQLLKHDTQEETSTPTKNTKQAN